MLNGNDDILVINSKESVIKKDKLNFADENKINKEKQADKFNMPLDDNTTSLGLEEDNAENSEENSVDCLLIEEIAKNVDKQRKKHN
ncbi:MAG: hypothetical protein RR088_00785 [Clostridia bacterium]